MGQWIVCSRYASLNIMIAGSSTTTILMQAATYATLQSDALETAPQEDFLVKRIVGQIYLNPTPGSPAAQATWGWRLMMLPVDLTGGTVETPWPVGAPIMTDPDIANAPRWWGERYYQGSPGGGELHGLATIENPWWTHVDLHPNAIGGPGPFGANMYPVLVADNTANAFDLVFRHRLRMYVETMGRKRR